MNLIEQMNVLKGLDDAMLQREVKAPSGGAPPYLVLSEINRRKDMRQRYEGELARRKPQTTVAEDTVAALGPSMTEGGPMAQAPAIDPAAMGSGAGIAAAAAPGMQPPGFADGGIVNFGDIAKRYQTELDGTGAERDHARALALLAASAGMLGGGHSNTLQNVGLGINAGVQSYGDALKTIDSRESGLLKDLTDIGLAQQDKAYRDRTYADSQDPNNIANLPESIREANAINAMPDGPQKDLAMQMASPVSALTAQAHADAAAQIGEGIVNGTVDPNKIGYKSIGDVTAYLAKEHPEFSLMDAQQNALAATKLIGTMNSQTQVRQQQAINTVIGPDGTGGMLGGLQSIVDQWKAGPYPILNSANYQLAKQGALGPEAQKIAAELNAQLADVTPEIASIFRGGTSPTEVAMQHADKMFDQNTSNATFDALIALARRNLKYRQDALNSVTTGGVPAGNPAQQPIPAAVDGPAQVTTGTSGNVQFTVEP